MAKPKLNNPSIPDVHVTLTYDNVYDDYATINPLDIIKDIPTLSILHFVVQMQNKVLYAFSDHNTQRTMMQQMCGIMPKALRPRIWKFMRNNRLVNFITNETTFLLYRLALSCYTPLEPGDTIDLCEDEYEPIYKAILYCNQVWTDSQTQQTKSLIPAKYNHPYDLIDVSLRIDLPIVEFKLYKDFKTQLYKAATFFRFCQDHDHYKDYLAAFIADHNVGSWEEYLTKLFSFYSASLSGMYIDTRSQDPADTAFFDQFIIDINDPKLQNLWNDPKWMGYLRSHFLLPIVSGYYLLLNANLLVDKMYQGMKFDFYQSICKHKLKSPSGKKFADFPDFNSIVGTDFSEPHLLYPIMQKVFNGKADCMLTGEQMKANGIVGEPDYYMRIEDTLYLFEFKDLTLGDQHKFNPNVSVVKKELLDRLCCDYVDPSTGKNKRKGGGQLLETLDGIFNRGMLSTLDPDINKVRYVYPIIMTTDTVFTAIGVNALVTTEFNNLLLNKHNFKQTNVLIYVPVVFDYDTLLKLAWRFATERLDINKVLHRYIQENSYKLSPLSTHVIDTYLRGTHMTSEESEYMLSDVITA